MLFVLLCVSLLPSAYIYLYGAGADASGYEE